MATLKSSRAFLLFEVLVAVVVLAVGITFVMRSFSTSVSAVKGIEDYFTASSLIEEKIFQLETLGIDKVPREGRFESGLEKFSWKINSTPASDLSLYKVNLSIIWDTQNTAKVISVETYLKQPLSR